MNKIKLMTMSQTNELKNRELCEIRGGAAPGGGISTSCCCCSCPAGDTVEAARDSGITPSECHKATS